jgi:hypothetical protein
MLWQVGLQLAVILIIVGVSRFRGERIDLGRHGCLEPNLH